MAWINVDGDRIYAGSIVDARRMAIQMCRSGRKEVSIYKSKAGKTLEVLLQDLRDNGTGPIYQRQDTEVKRRS